MFCSVLVFCWSGQQVCVIAFGFCADICHLNDSSVQTTIGQEQSQRAPNQTQYHSMKYILFDFVKQKQDLAGAELYEN